MTRTRSAKKLNRRTFVQASTAMAASGLALPTLASESPAKIAAMGKAEHCIMIWLGGGMAHIDTFDPKAMGDAKAKKAGSYYRSIDTAVPGIQVCEHLAETAKVMDRVTALRTVHHNVIDEHAAAANRMHTGRPTSGTVQYPSLGSMIAHGRGAAQEGVPAYMLIGYPNLTRGPGFLGQQAGYVYLTDLKTGPAGLARPDAVNATRQQRREKLLGSVRSTGKSRFKKDGLFRGYDAALAESLRLSGPNFMRVFDLKSESADLRESYGSEFGQRCLLARRLCESGVRFIEVSHNMNFRNGTGWDTHNQGQLKQHLLIQELDRGLSALIRDLESRKMLDRRPSVHSRVLGSSSPYRSRTPWALGLITNSLVGTLSFV